MNDRIQQLKILIKEHERDIRSLQGRVSVLVSAKELLEQELSDSLNNVIEFVKENP